LETERRGQGGEKNGGLFSSQGKRASTHTPTHPPQLSVLDLSASLLTLESSTMQLILGSSSASRRQILSEMGYQLTLLVGDFSPCFQMLDRSSYCFVHFPSLFLVFQSADIDEKAIRKEKPEELVVTLAHAKVISFSIFVRELDSTANFVVVFRY
jgi:hypothetical protein